MDCLSSSTDEPTLIALMILFDLSTAQQLNVAQLVGSQSGETIEPTFNWSDHFNKHTTKTAFKEIKKMQHFHLSHLFLDRCRWRMNVMALCTLIYTRNILASYGYRTPGSHFTSWAASEASMVIFDKVHEHCPDHCKDMVCPEPTEIISQ